MKELKLECRRTLEEIASVGHCLGAVFCTYTFDPAFFEEHVLPRVLRLTSDPVEQTAHYLDEGLGRLQETPVVCFRDGGMRQPGHRLPYDLLDVHSRVFHPKLTLLLYETCARFSIGSGNLTRGGFGDNTELFYSVDLEYDDAEAVALLLDVSSFLKSVHQLARNAGKRFAEFMGELDTRLKAAPARAGEDVTHLFLHTERGQSILEQFLSLIPEKSRIVRIGALAPFYEMDDEDAATEEELDSVLATLCERADKECGIELGVLWEESPTAPTGQPAPEIKGSFGHLWAMKADSENDGFMFFTLTGSKGNQILLRDWNGGTGRLSLDDLNLQRQSGDIWYAGAPSAFAPRNLIDRLRKRFQKVDLYLHPSWRIENGRRLRRPLHAKLIVLTLERRNQLTTLVLMGSPNLSRRALLHTPERGGNVECALTFIIEGGYLLTDFVKELIWCDSDSLKLEERVYPPTAFNYAALIDSAVHDAEQKTLTVAWSSQETAVETWELSYGDRVLSSGRVFPTGTFTVSDFTLALSCCELTLTVRDKAFSIPITVLDLVKMPGGLAGVDLDLRELLAMLGRRMGRERIAAQRAAIMPSENVDEILEQVFGMGFGASDIFNAWRCVKNDLEEDFLSAQAVRVRLEGTLGVRAVWNRLRAAIELNAKFKLLPEEVWFYGAELLRTLSQVNFPQNVSLTSKRELLDAFLGQLRLELENRFLSALKVPSTAVCSSPNMLTFEICLYYIALVMCAVPAAILSLFIVVAALTALSTPSVVAAITSDLRAIRERDPAAEGWIACICYPGWWALNIHRLASHPLYGMGMRTPARLFNFLARFGTGCDIHPGAVFGRGVFIDHAHGVVIGETAIIGNNVTMLHQVTLGGTGKQTGRRHPTIEEGVLLGVGAKVLGNIVIGRNSKIGAGSVVVHAVPPDSTVVGIPGRVVASGGQRIPSQQLDQTSLPDPLIERIRQTVHDEVKRIEEKLRKEKDRSHANASAISRGTSMVASTDMLAEICEHKREEIDAMQQLRPVHALRQMPTRRRDLRNFARALKAPGISLIAEIKKASPSGGLLRADFNPARIADTYALNGAAALSVLTNEKYFQGSIEYLAQAREAVKLPILRKEFIVDSYQIIEAERYGADAVLLIAACLDETRLRDFRETAEGEGLDALVEVHDEAELEMAIRSGASIVGINNRNLKTLKTNLETTFDLLKKIPAKQRTSLILVSESGIRTNADIRRLEDAGIDAVLIGETFMRAPDIGAKVREVLGVDPVPDYAI